MYTYVEKKLLTFVDTATHVGVTDGSESKSKNEQQLARRRARSQSVQWAKKREGRWTAYKMLVTGSPTLFVTFKVSWGMLRIRFARPTPPFFHYSSNTHLLIQYTMLTTPAWHRICRWLRLIINNNWEISKRRESDFLRSCYSSCIEGRNDSYSTSLWSTSLEEGLSSKVVQGTWDQGKLEG